MLKLFFHKLAEIDQLTVEVEGEGKAILSTPSLFTMTWLLFLL